MSKNPYNLILGKEPLQVISRAAQMAEILESFSEELASQQGPPCKARNTGRKHPRLCQIHPPDV